MAPSLPASRCQLLLVAEDTIELLKFHCDRMKWESERGDGDQSQINWDIQIKSVRQWQQTRIGIRIKDQKASDAMANNLFSLENVRRGGKYKKYKKHHVFLFTAPNPKKHKSGAQSYLFLPQQYLFYVSFMKPAAAGSVAWISTEEGEGALFGGKFKLAHSFRENCIRSAPRHASKQPAASKKRVSPSSGNSSYDS